MNIYDTKVIFCSRCETSIGEVDFEAKIINALCGKCANPIPEGDKILYTISHFQTQAKQKIPQELVIKV